MYRENEKSFWFLCLPVLSRPLSEVEGKSKYGVSMAIAVSRY